MKRIALITAVNAGDPYNLLSISLGPLALESYLTAKGTDEVYLAETIEEIEKIAPDIVGISAVTENYGRAIELANRVKTLFDIPVIIGGVHITSCPESLDQVFSAGVIGEGEETLLELLSSWPQVENVPGIVFHGDGRIRSTGRRPPLKDLNTLPHPHRKKWVETLGLPIIMTSRGCAHKCRFCSSPVMWGGYRDFTPEYVISEIRNMIESFQVRHIRLFDDTLTLNRKRLERLVELIVSEGIHREISFSCLSRIDQLDLEMIRLLLRANIRFVSVGLETASDTVLSTLKDRGAGAMKSQQVIDMAHEEGLNISCSVIIGSPGETERDLLETYSFLANNEKNLYEVEVNPIVPHPGTAIWDYALGRGLVSIPMDWSRLKDYSNILLFDRDRYIYLNEEMPYERFLSCLSGFKGLFRRGLKADPAHFAGIGYPAKLKSV